MRNIFLFVGLILLSSTLHAQKVHGLNKSHERISGVIPMEIAKKLIIENACHHGDAISHDIYKPYKNKGRRLKSNPVQFNIEYDATARFPQELIDAFELGLIPLLQEFYSSDQVIDVFVLEIDPEQFPNAVAAAGSRSFTNLIPSAPCFTCVYVASLAEKLLNENYNDVAEDIVVLINSDNNFYFDYENPENIGSSQIDFVTVLFHEFLHGMGFVGAAGLNDDESGDLTEDMFDATYAFDFYLENGNGQLLRDAFDNNSLRLGTALTNDDLYFNAFKIGQVDERAKLYAPREYADGSSVHHLDRDTYQQGFDVVMTPTVRRGIAYRNAGLGTEIMYDIGWALAKVEFLNSEFATEELDQDVMLSAEVISDLEYDASSFVLHISTDTFETETIIPMNATGSTNIFEAILEATGAPQNIQFYTEITDSRGVTRTTPSPAPEFYFEYQFILDNQGPEILHDPISVLNETDNIRSLDISADATDNLGISSMFIEWRLNGSDAIELAEMMFNEEGGDFAENEYIGTIEFGRALTGNDILEYRISATDIAKGRNTSTFPADGSFISVPVTPETPPVNFYANDFNTDTEDFEGNGFSIRQERNFSDPAIHSNHPYANAGGGNSLNLTFELKIPIIIEEQRPVIEFEEVVLVEPGEPGVSFGEERFWDYVIVEGKKRGTQEWLPFLDGYDSRENSNWQNAFENSISGAGCDSRAVSSGTSSQLQTRKINMVESGNFAFGDTVAVRFRLFSDPCLGGWGWTIDNLAIQDLNSDVEDFVKETNFDIIPNPANQQVLISLDLEEVADDMVISLVDITGRVVSSHQVVNKSVRIRERMDIGALESGVYIVNVTFNNRDIIAKKLIKQ